MRWAREARCEVRRGGDRYPGWAAETGPGEVDRAISMVGAAGQLVEQIRGQDGELRVNAPREALASTLMGCRLEAQGKMAELREGDLLDRWKQSVLRGVAEAEWWDEMYEGIKGDEEPISEETLAWAKRVRSSEET